MSQEGTHLAVSTVLEAPPISDLPEAKTAALFDSIAHAVAHTKKVSLETLLDIMVRDQSFRDFTRDILMVVMKTVKSEAGTLFELDHENACLFFRAVVGKSSDQLPAFTVPLAKGIVGQVARTHQPVIVGDAQSDGTHLKSIGDMVGFEARNLIAVPLFIRGRVFGVVELLNRVGEDSYTQGDLELLVYLCDALSKIIEMRLMLGWALQAAHAAAQRENEAA